MNMILLFTILLPAFISTMFIPYWTRRTESFGVTIPEAIYYTDKLKQLRKRYVSITGLASIIVAILFFLFNSFHYNDNVIAILFSALIFLYILATFFVYLYFHQVMKRLKLRENWGKEKSQQVFVSTDFRKQKLTHSNLWFGVSFLITFATIAITLRYFDHIPNQIPIQYNFDGLVTNWATKSVRSALAMPIISLYLSLLFMFLNAMIAKAKQQISAEKPEESMQQNIVFRRRWSAYLIGTGIGVTLLFSFIQLTIIFSINSQLINLVTAIFVIVLVGWAIILSITTGQGGSRVKVATGSNGEIIDRDDDKHWKLGMFYFNKQDPAMFLEKRFGVGWTINLARPLAWIIFIVIILLAVGIPTLLGI
ncbi:DUF1648 domain-containing protein [Ornithinibacillus scapharcae]|uniref:DUF1648 domain-containing protein n=1 Tax=Ornithinibacillus scapharcae TaxID=1147159 RepID=UPI000225BA65|nr:DUF5808 domain-containing protein [Ornithinibacillus scapharcae]